MADLTDGMRSLIKEQLYSKPQRKPRPNTERRSSAGLWVKPFASDALGCGEDQIDESREYLRAHGVMADFDKEGRCIITSEKQYQAVAKAFGMKSGRDGYEVRNEEGNQILTGKRPVQERRRFKEELAREIRNYQS